ncbi:uncharacterized protein LOC120265056 [Dioscorea cayenensis subsp. rotundata]|uniref:Uncharacterized protein LOC120265056 n=1 Tax=Dioscorea cayennensis subsp. rotundata TaxID=55577 RepID=A0AB40BN71_DIOCR|nr:uncharacterized protein LOC120265056 [Dioscorea cayenensis subsp. rotundata]
MAKNIFDILNSVNKLWVDIFKLKYHGWHVWNPANVSQSSWFYKSICNSANFIKPNLRILSCNPTSVDFLHDPCLLDLPFSKKPTFLNMSADLEDLHFSDLCTTSALCFASVGNLLGHYLNWDLIGKITISRDSPNRWVWGSLTSKSSTASAVYHDSNCLHNSSDTWLGWSEIWKLVVLPHTKSFIWKLAHGKLATGAFLYSLNIGPFMLCPFCGLEEESTAHLLWLCTKIFTCWANLLLRLGLSPLSHANFDSGAWLTTNYGSRFFNFRVKALIATLTWLIWKQRCNLIFRKIPTNLSSLVPQAWSLCTDISLRSSREVFTSLDSSHSVSIYSDASWLPRVISAGLGFVIIDSSNRILLA